MYLIKDYKMKKLATLLVRILYNYKEFNSNVNEIVNTTRRRYVCN